MPQSTAALVEAHEDRIQRLESNVLDMNALVSETKVRVEGLDEKFDSMNGKIDRILVAVEKHDDRIQRLEEHVQKRRSTVKWISGIVGPVIVAIILAIIGLK